MSTESRLSCSECDGDGNRYDDEDFSHPCIECDGTGKVGPEAAILKRLVEIGDELLWPSGRLASFARQALNDEQRRLRDELEALHAGESAEVSP